MLSVMAAPNRAAITESTKEMLQQSLGVAVVTPVIWLHLNGETNGINENKVDTFNKIGAPVIGCFTLLLEIIDRKLNSGRSSCDVTHWFIDYRFEPLSLAL